MRYDRNHVVAPFSSLASLDDWDMRYDRNLMKMAVWLSPV